MELLHYSINVDKLKAIQEEQTQKNREEELLRKQEGLQNKKRLLKYVLPFLHGLFAIHNNKCRNADYSTTGKDGLLGYSPIDIEKELQYMVDTEHHLIWKDNFRVFNYDRSSIDVDIWLNTTTYNKEIRTPHLEYSMGNVYGDGIPTIESELEAIAKHCSRSTDNW